MRMLRTALALLTTGLLAACGNGAVTAGSGGTSPTEPSSASSAPSSGAAHADLTIVVHDGSAEHTWHLTCSPDGGDHPDPAAACAALTKAGDPFAPLPKGILCSQIYGGAQKATVTGTWKGRAVNASFSRTDGCKTAQWAALQQVFQPGSAGANT